MELTGLRAKAQDLPCKCLIALAQFPQLEFHHRCSEVCQLDGSNALGPKPEQA